MALNNPGNRVGSGRFTNLQRYLDVNDPSKLRSSITGKLQGDVGSIKNQLGEAQSQFQSAADAGKLGTQQDEQLVGSTLSRIAPGADVQQAANPTVSESDIIAFQRFLGGKYQGPQELANLDPLRAKAGDIENLSRTASTDVGKFGLLSRYIGQPGYNLGQQRFDVSILGPQGLGQARRAGIGLTRNVDTAQDKARAQANQYRTEAKQFGEKVGNKLEGTKSEIGQQIENKLKEVRDQQTSTRDLFNTAMDKLNKGESLSEQELNLLGIARGSTVYGLGDLTHAFNEGLSPEQITSGMVASPTQRSQIEALAKLAGKDPLTYLKDFTPSQTELTKEQIAGFNPEEFKKAEDITKAQQEETLRTTPIQLQPFRDIAGSGAAGPSDNSTVNFSTYNYEPLFKQAPQTAGLTLGTAEPVLNSYKDQLTQGLRQAYAEAFPYIDASKMDTNTLFMDLLNGSSSGPYTQQIAALQNAGIDISPWVGGPRRSKTWMQNLGGAFRHRFNDLSAKQILINDLKNQTMAGFNRKQVK